MATAAANSTIHDDFGNTSQRLREADKAGIAYRLPRLRKADVVQDDMSPGSHCPKFQLKPPVGDYSSMHQGRSSQHQITRAQLACSTWRDVTCLLPIHCLVSCLQTGWTSMFSRGQDIGLADQDISFDQVFTPCVDQEADEPMQQRGNQQPARLRMVCIGLIAITPQLSFRASHFNREDVSAWD